MFSQDQAPMSAAALHEEGLRLLRESREAWESATDLAGTDWGRYNSFRNSAVSLERSAQVYFLAALSEGAVR